MSIRLWALAGLVLVVLGYLPGISGALYYDDYSNLDGLSSVADLESATQFVLGGHAGPLGRPVALASFLPMTEGWPGNSQQGLLVNIGIHALNFFLLFCLGRLVLVRSRLVTTEAAAYIALGSAFLWAILPILASTSLILIQRMTSLSAFFGLLGLVGYVYGYRWAERSPYKGAFCQLVVLGLMTIIAAFTKESGALIPLFALVLDLLCMRGGCLPGRAAQVRRFVLVSVSLCVLYRISPFYLDYFAFSEYRGYSVAQRLITQTVILWEYFFRAFVPLQPTVFGPFHDYYGVRDANAVFYLALAGWTSLVVVAFRLRATLPLFTLAVTWFVVGHLLESTVVMLELYFEHRNYLALWGFCLFFCWLSYAGFKRFGRVVIFGMGAYFGLMWILLFSITSMWGNQALAAETWATKHPGSARAALHAVFVEMGKARAGANHEGNERYIEGERLSYAFKVLKRTMGACPDCIDIRMQALLLACKLQNKDEQRALYSDLIALAEEGLVNSTVITLSFDFTLLVGSGGCGAVTSKELGDLFLGLRENKALQYPLFSQKLYFSQAMLAESSGDWSSVKSILDDAAREAQDSAPILQYQVYSALESKDLEYGYAALESRASVDSEEIKSLLPQLRHQLDSARELEIER